MASQLGLAFPVLLDADKAVSQRFELASMPSTVLIDRDGPCATCTGGYQAGYEALYEKQIRELLKE